MNKLHIQDAKSFPLVVERIVKEHGIRPSDVSVPPDNYPCAIVFHETPNPEGRDFFEYEYVYATDVGQPELFGLEHMKADKDGFDVALTPSSEAGRNLCKIFAMHLLAQLDEVPGATNYIEFTVHEQGKDGEDTGRGVVVTVKHQFGQTPHQLRAEAERAAAAAIDFQYKLARLILNSGKMPPFEWGEQSIALLAELRKRDPAKYDEMTKPPEYDVGS